MSSPIRAFAATAPKAPLQAFEYRLDWTRYIAALKPKGRLHHVGAVLEPMAINTFPLIMAQRSLSASPIGSPATVDTMLEFCARHSAKPVTENFPLSRANDALEHLRSGKARCCRMMWGIKLRIIRHPRRFLSGIQTVLLLNSRQKHAGMAGAI